MMDLDFSVITPRGNMETLLRVVDGKVIIVPPPARPAPAGDSRPPPPGT